MAEFFVEKNANEAGEHIVHSKICSSLPAEETMHYLGSFSTAQAAVNLSGERYSAVSTCPKCLPA